MNNVQKSFIEMEKVRQWPHRGTSSRIFVEGLSKSTKNLSLVSRCLGNLFPDIAKGRTGKGSPERTNKNMDRSVQNIWPLNSPCHHREYPQSHTTY
jgi:hypothetical protein